MLAPPSTGKTTPVTKRAAGEQRYVAASPMSLGVPKQFIGVRLKIFFERLGSPFNALSIIFDSIQPGAMAFTRTPCGETSVASERTSPG